MNTNFLFLLLFQATLLAVALMLVTWIMSLRLRNAGIIDVVWSATFALLALLYAGIGDGYFTRRVLLLLMVGIWSLRLAGFLFRRVHDQHPDEDPRYAQLRKAWGAKSDIRFLWFFELRGLAGVALSVPFALIALNPGEGLTKLELGALILWLVAVAGESLSDWQLWRFKADPAHRGRTLESGLWRYSRHPNYFFEWLVWCSYFLFALGAPYGWVTLYCPLLMFHILTRVTGVPLSEEQALRSRGDDYRSYQERTNAFFPWFSKKSS